MSMPIAVLGAGAWGTALAMQLAVNGHQVRIWGRNQSLINRINEQRTTDVFPQYTLPICVSATTNLAQALDGVGGAVIATPSSFFKRILEKIKHSSDCTNIIWACKGFAEGGYLLSSLAKAAGFAPHVLSGPTFAQEVMSGKPTALVIAGQSEQLAYWKQLFHHDSFRCYMSRDTIGVEVCGACKNIVAIAAGASDGLSLGANARTALITRGLHEIRQLGQSLGAKEQTFTGLAGLGDLVLTASDNLSRNRQYGLSLAHNQDGTNVLVEGIGAARIAYQIQQKHQLDLPILSAVYNVVSERVTLKEALNGLLSRHVGFEFEG